MSEQTLTKENNDMKKICIDDIVDLTLIMPNGKSRNQVIKLVDNISNEERDYKEVSINSPLGKVIIDATIGEKVDYQVNDKTITAIINSKCPINDLKQEKVKILKK